MIFEVSTSGRFYNDNAHKKRLEKIGFKFVESDIVRPFRKVTETVTVEIINLDQLISFSKKFGELIVSNGSIEIYDNYRE